MGNAANETTLFRIDPAQKMRRYYTIAHQQNLFGGHSVLRTWGRIGSGGQLKIDFFDDETSAIEACEELLKSKRKRGYVSTQIANLNYVRAPLD